MNILIIEPSANGHRFQYLVWAAKAFLQRRHVIIIGTKLENCSHPLLGSLQSEFPNQIHVYSAPGETRSNFLFREIYNWFWFRKIYKKIEQAHSIDRVFVPYMDHIFYAFALIGSPFNKTQFSGIIMGVTFHHRQLGVSRPWKNKDLFERILFARCLLPTNLETVFTLDPFLCESTYANRKLNYLPDPSSESILIPQKEARELLSIEKLDNIILVFGLITERKGIKELIEAVAEYDLNVHVLIVGIHDIATLQLLRADSARTLFKKNRLTSVDQYISAKLETAYYCAADIVWLGYRDHYAMSGVLVKAAACNRNVLACDEGLIGLLTKTYELGLTANINNHEEIASGINNILNMMGSADNFLMTTFAEKHTLAHFNKVIGTNFDVRKL